MPDRYTVRRAHSDTDTRAGWDLLLIGQDSTGGEIVTWANRFPTRDLARDAARDCNVAVKAHRNGH